MVRPRAPLTWGYTGARPHWGARCPQYAILRGSLLRSCRARSARGCWVRGRGVSSGSTRNCPSPRGGAGGGVQEKRGHTYRAAGEPEASLMLRAVSPPFVSLSLPLSLSPPHVKKWRCRNSPQAQTTPICNALEMCGSTIKALMMGQYRFTLSIGLESLLASELLGSIRRNRARTGEFSKSGI